MKQQKSTILFFLLLSFVLSHAQTKTQPSSSSSKASQATPAAKSASTEETQNDRITVQLSDPSRPATLKINIISGSIFVQGYTGKEVIVETRPIKSKEHEYDEDEDTDIDDKKRHSKQGLKRIPNLSSGISVEEEENEVTVNAGWRGHSNSIEIRVQVPTNCSMKLSTVNNGDIEVNDISGELEVNNINGSVTLNRISGSAVAHALNHPLTVTFVKVNPQKSMSFSSLNGEVDVTFPPDIKATFNMRSEQGEIYSDFDLELEKTTSKVEEKGKGRGRYKVTVERALKGKVNGGGQEFLFKNFNGNIYIRKGK